jgi:hypothetical protein
MSSEYIIEVDHREILLGKRMASSGSIPVFGFAPTESCFVSTGDNSNSDNTGFSENMLAYWNSILDPQQAIKIDNETSITWQELKEFLERGDKMRLVDYFHGAIPF